jgi:hypothetical protein
VSVRSQTSSSPSEPQCSNVLTKPPLIHQFSLSLLGSMLQGLHAGQMHTRVHSGKDAEAGCSADELGASAPLLRQCERAPWLQDTASQCTGMSYSVSGSCIAACERLQFT